MLHYDNMRDALPVLKALSADTRVHIMEILCTSGDKSMSEIATMLGLTNSAVTLHMNKLEEAGLIEVHTVSGIRGSMKICKPRYSKLIIDLAPEKEAAHCYRCEIGVGQYTNCRITPTCGLATVDGVIGTFDDPRYFSFPERFSASIIWFTSGYVEYSLPNNLQAGDKAYELQISFEIASEFPGYCEIYPSDIHFSINEQPLGCWVSPGDYGARRGRLNPKWWRDSCNQYGLLKMLIVNREGTFIDGGIKISDVTIDDLKIDYNSAITLRFAVPEETRNVGGLTLFGKEFGDYNQGIKFSILYE